MCTTRREYEGPTFGISLRPLCERSGVEVPFILGDILRWLAAHALAQPDVFAQPPKSAATSHLKSAIDSGVSLAELVEGTHPAVVGSLLKRWLEELPDPLLNWDQQVELLSACKDEGCIEARIASLNDAVALVDPISLGTLKPLLLFLQQYCFRQRRFDQQLLQVAVAFAPILFPAALAAGPAELRLAEETVATLVSNALHVFNPTLAANVPVVTPQALCEAAAEIMESQQQVQQPEYASETPGIFCPPDSQQSQADGGSPGQQAADPVGPVADEEAAYEPYMQDRPFLASLDAMVDNCVAAALFGVDDGADSNSGVGGFFGHEEDCASLGSSFSATCLSTGGAASSGGASSCSNASSTTSHPDQSQVAAACNQGSQQHQHQHHKQHQGVGSTSQRGGGLERDGTQLDLPYSPRAVLVMPPSHGEVASARASGTVAHPVVKAAGASPAKKLTALPGSVTLSELAQREVSEGGVFCIISAQPGTGLVVNPDPSAGGSPEGGAVVLGKAGAVTKSPREARAGGGGKSPREIVTTVLQQQQQQQQQHHQSPATADVCEMQATLVYPHARLTSLRRATEGGAASGTSSGGGAPAHGQSAEQEPLSGGRQASAACSSTSTTTATSSDPRQRRMAMGGGNGNGGSSSGGHTASAAPQQQNPQPMQHQPHLRQQSQQHQQQPAAVPAPGSSVAALYQHLPQLRPRLAGSSGAGVNPGEHLPPTTSVAAALHGGGGGCIAELGVAGHLRVLLTSSQLLLVREMATPEAMAHRVPIRSLTIPAMQSEKERLKRQLKDVAAVYEMYTGKSLTPALKEPLRPVYVRYHKIKALLNSGRAAAAAPYKENQGAGTTGRSGDVQVQKQASLPSTRPSVKV